MSRQLRSDDTNKMRPTFSNSSAGDLTFSGGTWNIKSTPCTGTINTFTLNASGWSPISPCFLRIEQTQANNGTAGQYEFNELVSADSNTITVRYPLQNNYTTGAQVIACPFYRNLTFTGTTTATPWDGQKGGSMLVYCDTFTLASEAVIDVAGGIGAGSQNDGYTAVTIRGGFRGGAGHQPPEGTSAIRSGRGEGHLGQDYISAGYPFDDPVLNNGNGAGSVSLNNGNLLHQGYNGGNAQGGTDRNGTASGNTQLTIMTLGGAGSGGGRGDRRGHGVGSGGSGGAELTIVARLINIYGSINSNGGDSISSIDSENEAGGGVGAGGSILIKGMVVNVGNGITALSGRSLYGSRTGSTGRIHVDYGLSFTGTSNPPASTRKDDYLLSSSGVTLSLG